MLKKHIAAEIRSSFDYIPTPSQDNAIIQTSEFLSSKPRRHVLMIRGFAGTGKTTLISALVRTLNKFGIESVLLAPTGRAAKVLSSYCSSPAYTIHKKIFRIKSKKDLYSGFVLDKNFHTDTLFIVDEASMITDRSNESVIFGSGSLLNDLISFVYSGKNCRLILIGDTAQLPPVGLDISPALEAKSLTRLGLNVTELTMTDVVRQSLDSGILYNATLARNMLMENNIGFPSFRLDGFADIERITGADIVETISDCYSKYGIENTMVICYSNKQANRYNSGIRNRILGREEEITQGDYMMIIRNNYFWSLNEELSEAGISFIANGDIIKLIKIRKYIDRFGFRFAEVTIKLIDYGDIETDVIIMLDTLALNTPSLSSDENKKLFHAVLEDYVAETNKRKRTELVLTDPYFNALQVKFSYAVTCHKAQGGQWKTVLIDQGYVPENTISREYLRWLYTALTRPVEKLYMINFRDRFFK
jgi:exodeoxyribonuclease-5